MTAGCRFLSEKKAGLSVEAAKYNRPLYLPHFVLHPLPLSAILSMLTRARTINSDQRPAVNQVAGALISDQENRKVSS